MMPEQATLIHKAYDNVRGAKVLINEGLSGIAASRAYYAMFYIAQAFLLSDGMAFSKHSGVIAAFGQYFANTDRVPRAFHRILIDAEQAREQIAYAEDFLEVAERVIGSLSPADGEAE